MEWGKTKYTCGAKFHIKQNWNFCNWENTSFSLSNYHFKYRTLWLLDFIEVKKYIHQVFAQIRYTQFHETDIKVARCPNANIKLSELHNYKKIANNSWLVRVKSLRDLLKAKLLKVMLYLGVLKNRIHGYSVFQLSLVDDKAATVQWLVFSLTFQTDLFFVTVMFWKLADNNVTESKCDLIRRLRHYYV